ncbi:MAG: hypothetical protein HW387_1016 [Parachlamydiales bacterium]|nr:hypothetical protein [Parachlamydiales bacterium]
MLDIETVLNQKIILCTGPSFGRAAMLKSTTEKDMKLIPFKKIFLSTNDPHNLKISFKGTKPICELLQKKDKQLDCLNCIISTIKNAVGDPDCRPDDIIIFKHESVYISDMHLVKQAIGKILAGYDAVLKYWIGFENQAAQGLKDYYHSDSFYIRVGAARPIFSNHALVQMFTKDYQFCEEYLTKHIVSKIPKVFKIDYHHSSWKDNELGFYHLPRYEEDPKWFWDKKNYNEIYR